MPPSVRSGPGSWVDAACLLAAGLALLFSTWGTWPDLLVDSGGEIYVAWQLAEGKALYTDIAWFHGPFSPWWNALLCSWFGTSLWTLMLFNVGLVAAMVLLLYRLVRSQSGRLPALASGLVFLGLFAFNGLLPRGSYTWISPYAHGATYGLAATVVMITLLDRAMRRRRPAALVGAGVCLGVAFLTKPEAFVAALAGAAVCLGLGSWAGSPPWRRARTGLPLFLGGAALAIAAALVRLLVTMPPDEALTSLWGGWPAVLDGRTAELPFFRANMGLLAPWENLGTMLRLSGWALVLFLPPALLALAVPRLSLRARTLAVLLLGLAALVLAIADWQKVAIAAGGPSTARILILSVLTATGIGVLSCVLLRRPRVPPDAVLPSLVFVVTGLALVRKWHHVSWYHLARPLPVLVAVLLGVSMVSLIGDRRAARDTRRRILDLAALAVSLTLLGKMLLAPVFGHYGFTLALPATLVLLAAAGGRGPALIRRRGGRGEVLTAAFLAVVLVLGGGLLEANRAAPSVRTHAIGCGGDAFRADEGTQVVREFLVRLEEHAAPHQTLAVLPEGVMLNYLARRPSSVAYFNYLPPDVSIFTEAAIVAAFEARPPDFIALVDRPTPEYRQGTFGTGFGRDLMAWVNSHYHPVERIEASKDADPPPWCGWIVLLARDANAGS